MTAPSLPDALATFARLDETMRPAARAATPGAWLAQIVSDDYPDDGAAVIAAHPVHGGYNPSGGLVASVRSVTYADDERVASDYNASHIAAACPLNTLALLDAAGALVSHIEALTKRAEAAERDRDWARQDSAKFSSDFREQKRRAQVAEAALATAQETIARLTAALKPFTSQIESLERAYRYKSFYGASAPDNSGTPLFNVLFGDIRSAACLLADLKPADATEADRG